MMFRGSRFAMVMRLWVAAFTLLIGLTSLGPPRPLAAASDLGLEMPEEVDFGRLRVGQTATRQVPIRNESDVPLWLRSVGLLDRGAGGGIVPLLNPWESHGCSNQWLQPGATCNVEVTVRGGRDGRQTAGIVAQHYRQRPETAEDAKYDTWEGTIVAVQVFGGTLRFVEREHDFGGTFVGDIAWARFTIRNTTDRTYTFKGADITGGGVFGGDGGFKRNFNSTPDSYFQNQCRSSPGTPPSGNTSPSEGMYLGPGQECTVPVKFMPEEAGWSKRMLEVKLTNQNREVKLEILMTGLGLEDNGKLGRLSTYPVGGIDFGQQAVGTTSKVKRALIQNDGQGTIMIEGLKANPPFSIEHDCTNYLKPRQNCVIEVKFAPTEAGAITNANIYLLLRNVEDAYVQIPLRGVGVGPSPSPSPSPSASPSPLPSPSPSASPSPSPTPSPSASPSPSPSASPSPSPSAPPSPSAMPQPPVNLVVVETTCHEAQGIAATVVLAWDAPESGPVGGYRIYRSRIGDGWVVVGETTALTFTDGATITADSPTCHAGFIYVVRTLDGSQESLPSNEVYAWP